MLKKIEFIIIASVALIGCASETKEKSSRLESFFCKEFIPYDKYKESADSVFNCQYILGQEGEFFVYVFDGNCSSCVMETLDFVKSVNSLKKQNIPKVLFFTKAENNDIFSYYYDQLVAPELHRSAPFCYQMYDRNDISNGLYFIEKGLIKGYLPWHY